MKTNWARVPLYRCLLQGDVYRGSQGRLIRHLVFLVLFFCVLVACQRVYSFTSRSFDVMSATAFACVILATGIWVAYRLIQYQPVADFLIDVQLESSKVSWSTWGELRRTTCVVLVAMLIVSVYLFACDVSWQFLLRSLSVLSI